LKDKKKILVCIDWYIPGFKAGGPIRSVANIVNAFKNEFDFYILTSAYDLGESEAYEGVDLNLWHEQDGVFVKYLEKHLLNSSAIGGNIKEVEPDIIYLNSLFSRVFTLIPLAIARKNKIKTILAPRGMTGAGALGIKKTKKVSFIKLAKLLGWYKNLTWHASTKEEGESILKQFGKNSKVLVAQYIPLSQQLEINNILDRKNTGKVKFVFISRITLVKNLNLAINAFKNIKSDQEVEFDIYGNIEDVAYYNTLKADIKKYDNVTISYKGLLNPNDIADTYANADFMILPTMHENYGHAIVEAWSNGCPVIISKNTPWKNLRVQDLGWDIDITDPDNLTKAVQEGIDLDFTSYIQMVRASYNYFSNKICDDEILEANRKLFTDEN
jgi:glycosyltransferase involved in cell wall biosynthesis